MGNFTIVSAWHGLQTKSDDSVLCAWEFTSTWLSLANDHTSLPELLLSPNFAFIVIYTIVVPLVVLNGYKKVCWILTYNLPGFNFLRFLMEIWNHSIPILKWWLVWKHGDFALVLLWPVVVCWWQLESRAPSVNPWWGLDDQSLRCWSCFHTCPSLLLTKMTAAGASVVLCSSGVTGCAYLFSSSSLCSYIALTEDRLCCYK